MRHDVAAAWTLIQRRWGSSLALALSVAAILFNLLGWMLIPAAAEAAIPSSVDTIVSADICRSDGQGAPATAPKGMPVCAQCFPLASPCSGALVPVVETAAPSLVLLGRISSPEMPTALRLPRLSSYSARAPPL